MSFGFGKVMPSTWAEERYSIHKTPPSVGNADARLLDRESVSGKPKVRQSVAAKHNVADEQQKTSR